MPFKYVNFRGEEYFLYSRKTKKGNIAYHFSKKEDGPNAMDEIPSGYEAYENPNGRVFLRKKQEQLIRSDELAIIEKGIKKYSDIKDFKLDVKKNIVTVYISEHDFEDNIFPMSVINTVNHYDGVLRFVLTDKEDRTFQVDRFCYLGSIDDWIDLDESDDLESLVKEYVPHLGKESFYELL